MTIDIASMFYAHGGYTSESAYSDQTNYISYEDLTATYIPQSVQRLDSLCMVTTSVSYVVGTVSTGDLMDDVILAELALSIADSIYDKLHVDPETGRTENKHRDVAMKYMLDMYGVASNKYKLLLPKEVALGERFQACMEFEISTASD